MKLSDVDENFKAQNVDEPDIEWHSIFEDAFDLYGVYFSEQDGEYLRFSKDFAKSFNDYVLFHANRTAGGRIKFTTDSPYVAIKVDANYWGFADNMSVYGLAGISLYTDEYFSKSFCPPVANMPLYEKERVLSFDGIYKIARPHTAGVSHDFTVYFPLYNGVKKMYIGIKKGSTLTNGKKYTHQKPVFFYGSSITMGSAASRSGTDYVSTVCRMLDTDYINYGLAGQAKGQKEMAEHIAKFNPSVYVVDYDYNAPSVEYLQQTHYPFYSILRKAHPDTPIVFMTQPNTDYCETTEGRRAVVLDTFNRAKGEGDKNVYFIDGDTLFEGELKDSCTVDGCHPNDLGFYRMAKAVYPVLNKLLNEGKE